MNVTPRKREAINRRRAAVARYRAQGLTVEAISHALAAEGELHPSGKRWGVHTLNKDILFLKARYLLNADADIASWINAELEVLNHAMQAALQGVAEKSKVVVGYRHVQRRDAATGTLQEMKEPIFETVENLSAIDRVIRISESRRRLLAVDRVFQQQLAEREDQALQAAARIAAVFQQAPATLALPAAPAVPHD